MQRPSVIGLAATQNHCTIAHITVLLVALTAHRLGYEDKIRYVKSFFPSLTQADCDQIVTKLGKVLIFSYTSAYSEIIPKLLEGLTITLSYGG